MAFFSASFPLPAPSVARYAFEREAKKVLQEFVWVQTAQPLETSYTHKFLQKK